MSADSQPPAALVPRPVVLAPHAEALLADVRRAVTELEEELAVLEDRLAAARLTAEDGESDPTGESLLRLADDLRREAAVDAERLVADARARAEAILERARAGQQPSLRLADPAAPLP